ncbi:hypothetical protein NAV11_20265 [Pseudomonas songnenensis]|uniref:Uncharacterized protein n=1 Tax=Pseudomonas songnenensis TaxID=1176259 RepID=A0ABX9URJ7_9PSED|nr:hypothetical protein [Pseudomonas songnenensis]MCQ4302255.1 hypothetical protein [Pseudomonas songnenensis]RMH95400.1 hypothetical protein EA798_16535 [Pseudomonas songnenensis]
MNDTLKVAGRIGAELGAAKAEVERLRGLLRDVSDVFEGQHPAPGLVIARVRNTLSQQAEPKCVTCNDVGIVGHSMLCPECADTWQQAKPAPAQDERSDELEAIHQYAFEVGGTEGGEYILEPEELDEVVRRANEPLEDVLRSLACSLGAGGYNAPTVDPAVFEQKIRWGIDQLTRPAQTEQQPVTWQFYQDGKWWNGDDRIKDHRKNTEAAGIPVRDLYAAPIAQTAPQPEQSGLVTLPRELVLRAVAAPTKNSVRENHSLIIDRGRAQAEIRAALSAVTAERDRLLEAKTAAALHAAVSAIYFDDNSDFCSALWEVVRSLAPELVDELESNPSAVWHKTESMAAKEA